MKIEFAEDWAEILAFILLIGGFVLATTSRSVVVAYVVVFLVGMIFGRIWWKFKKGMKVPLFLTIIGFLIGFLLGSLYADKRLVILFFTAGMIISYWLHEQYKIFHV